MFIEHHGQYVCLSVLRWNMNTIMKDLKESTGMSMNLIMMMTMNPLKKVLRKKVRKEKKVLKKKVLERKVLQKKFLKEQQRKNS